MGKKGKTRRLGGSFVVRQLPDVKRILKEYAFCRNLGIVYKPDPNWKPFWRGSTIGMPGTRVGNLTRAGYIQVYIAGRKYMAHRLVWKIVTGNDPEGIIDHINGIRDDNRIENLRDVSFTGNAANAIRGRWKAEQAARLAIKKAIRLSNARKRRAQQLARMSRSSGLLSFGG